MQIELLLDAALSMPGLQTSDRELITAMASNDSDPAYHGKRPLS